MVSRGTPIQEPEWYLEIAGERTGPFTAEQVMGFLTDGEIPAEQRITSATIGGRWITAADLAAQAGNAPSLKTSAAQMADPADDLGFQPPPRPTDLDRMSPTTDRPRQDAALNLFDALQTAKDRQGARWTPPEKGSWTAASRQSSWLRALGPMLQKLKSAKITPELRRQISIGTLAVIALLSVWGVVRLVWKSRPTPTTPPVASAPAPRPPQQPLVQGVAPPRGPPAARPMGRALISDRDNGPDRMDDRRQREREEERARELAERAVRDEMERYRDDRDRDEREPRDRESREGSDHSGGSRTEEYRVPPRGRTGIAAPPSAPHRGTLDPPVLPADPRSIVDPETEPQPAD